MRRWTAAPELTVGVALLACAGYTVLGRAAGNVYPFSSFPMYATPHAAAGSRIAARDENGRLRELSRFARFDCDGAPPQLDLSPARCGPAPDYFYIPYLDRDAADYVASHRGPIAPSAPGALRVTLVRHVWSFAGAPAGEGAPRERDCALYACRAVPR